ncbi:hypothetical protein TNCV_4430651 [Trichonephila clavipes]|nr:hypothetical protein TNCV_4430651 [Trichonephila clavipes]
MPPKRSVIGRSTKQAKGEEKKELQKQVSREKLGKKEIELILLLFDHYKQMNRGKQGSKGIEIPTSREDDRLGVIDKVLAFGTEGAQFESIPTPVRLAFAMTINKAQGQSFKQLALTFVLMDNNARPHRADIVYDYLKRRDCAYGVSSRFPPPATLIELEIALQEEW